MRRGAESTGVLRSALNAVLFGARDMSQTSTLSNIFSHLLMPLERVFLLIGKLTVKSKFYFLRVENAHALGAVRSHCK